MLANRLRKRQRHLRKWARRQAITCYRLYDRDIPEYPLIVDWYDGAVVVWIVPRKGQPAPFTESSHHMQLLHEIVQGLAVAPEAVYFKERARQHGKKQYQRQARQEHIRLVQEQGLQFEVNLSDYLDTGLFLDHRHTRALIRDAAAGSRFLNLFAYTGSFTCYACAGGAESTTTVDISKTYTDWAGRNLQHNGFRAGRRHRLVAVDCFRYLQDAVHRGERFDLIVCDPPTFSNSKRMQRSSFDVRRDHGELIRQCLRLLAPLGALYFSTNARRFRFDAASLPGNISGREITAQTTAEDFQGKQAHRCWRITAAPGSSRERRSP